MKWTIQQNRTSELYHYGVKGMRWGVRKERETSGKKNNKSVKPILKTRLKADVDTGRIVKPDNSNGNSTSSTSNSSKTKTSEPIINKLDNGKIEVTNIGIKGCTKATFKSEDLYERWKNGTLTGKETVSMKGGSTEHTYSGSMGASDTNKKDSSEDFRTYWVEFGENYYSLINDVKFDFDNEEDMNAFFYEMQEQYYNIAYEYAKEMGWTTEEADKATKDPDKFKNIIDSLNDSQREALNDILGYALVGSGTTVEDFINSYIESLR